MTYESPASDLPDYFSRQPTGSRSLHTLSMEGTPLSIDPGILRARTPMATRISPYLHRMSPTTSQVSSSLRRTASRVYYQGGGGPLTSPLMTPSSFSEASGPPFFLAGHQHHMSNSSTSVQMTHQKRESMASMPGTSPVPLSKLQQPPPQRPESQAPSSLFDRGDRLTIRSEGIVVVKTNTNFFDSEESPLNIPLLDPAKEMQYNIWRLLYAEMMFSWGLFEARAELLKFLTIPRAAPHRLLSSSSVSFQQQQQQQQQPLQRGSSMNAGGMASSASSATSMSFVGASAVAMATKDDQPTALERILGMEKRGLQIGNKCFECETRLLPNYRCDFCRKVRPGIKCAICHLSVRGQTSACLKCGHGGHTEHYREWFVQERNTVCPTGCGCECMLDFGGWTGGLPVRPPIHPQHVASSVS
ncbi:GATOR complex protein wdr59 [Actinomortierella ambigua]|nr:GATOR complex protein wdr59 [Actinomortierella ambigua]